jgi:hypothetical protein
MACQQLTARTGAAVKRTQEKGRGGNMPSSRPYWSASLLALLAAGAGCREELGPVPLATTRVSGEVQEGGRPVAGGWIEFLPVEGTVGNLRSAPLDRNGRFEASKVAVGRNVIGLAAAPIRLPGGRRLFRTQASPIRRDIPPGPSSTLKLDLLVEAYRHEKQKREQASAAARPAVETPR